MTIHPCSNAYTIIPNCFLGGQAGGTARRGFKRPVGGKPAAGGQRRERKAPPTAEELDAELDSYINDMKI